MFNIKKLIILTLFILLASFVSAIDLDGTNCSANLTVGGATYDLVSNMTCGGNALNIEADDILIDCHSYTISGFGSNRAFNVLNRNNITIQNCVVDNFEYGVYFDSVNDSFFIDNNVTRAYNRLINGLNNYFEGNYLNHSSVDEPLLGIYNEDYFTMVDNNLSFAHSNAPTLWVGNWIGDESEHVNLTNNWFWGNNLTTVDIMGSNHIMDANWIVCIDGTALDSRVINFTFTNIVIWLPDGTGYIPPPPPMASLGVSAINPLTAASEWYYVREDLNISNTTFRSDYGSIRYPGIVQVPAWDELRPNRDLMGTPRGLSVYDQNAFANSSHYSYLNDSAQITFFDVYAGKVDVVVDFEDDDSYIPCQGSVCTPVGFSGTDYVFNVSHFTQYELNETYSTLNITTNPNTNITVANGTNFTVTSSAKCLAANCGDLTVTLDPIGISALTGNVEWTNNLTTSVFLFGSYYTSPKRLDLPGDDIVIASVRDGIIYGLNGSTGLQEWNFSFAALRAWNTYLTATPALGDVTGDGVVDLVAAEYGGYIAILNPVNGSVISLFDASTIGFWMREAYTHLTIADIDSDGVSEFLLPHSDSSLFAFEYNSTTNNISVKWISNMTSYCYDMAGGPSVADIDGDSDNEVVYYCFENVVAVEGSNGSYIWNHSVFSDPGFVSVGDLNNNSSLEVVISDYNVGARVLSASTGNLIRTINVTNPDFIEVDSVTPLADLDGDGDLEIIFSAFYAPWPAPVVTMYFVYDCLGNQLWNSTGIPGWQEYTAFSIADIDGDLISEISFVSYDNNLTILSGSNGSILFNEAIPGLGFTGSKFIAPLIADIDNDGVFEVVAVRNGNNDAPISSYSFGAVSGVSGWNQVMFDDANTGFYEAVPVSGSAVIGPTLLSTNMSAYCNASLTVNPIYSVLGVEFTISSPASAPIVCSGVQVGGVWQSCAFTIDSLGVWNCSANVSYTDNSTNDSVGFDTSRTLDGSKNGVIPMNSGSPFYTISPNPQTCTNLLENQTCNITWNVVANGTPGSKWKFFINYSNVLGNPSLSPTRLNNTVQSDPWFVTLSGNQPGPSPSPRSSGGGGGSNSYSVAPLTTMVDQTVKKEVVVETPSPTSKATTSVSQEVEAVSLEEPVQEYSFGPMPSVETPAPYEEAQSRPLLDDVEIAGLAFIALMLCFLSVWKAKHKH